MTGGTGGWVGGTGGTTGFGFGFGFTGCGFGLGFGFGFALSTGCGGSGVITIGFGGTTGGACVCVSAVPMSAMIATPPTPRAVSVGFVLWVTGGRTCFTTGLTGAGGITGSACTTTGGCGADGVTSGGAWSAGGDSTTRSDFRAENHRRPAPAREAEAATTASSGNGRGRTHGILPEAQDDASPGRTCNPPRDRI